MDIRKKNFLKRANLSKTIFEGNITGCFLMLMFFIVIQFFVSPVLPLVSGIITICLLACCKIFKKERYGVLGCSFIQMMILMILWWIDGWCAVSLITEKTSFYALFLIGTFAYVVYVLWRISFVKRRIEANWYETLSREGKGSWYVIFIAIVSIAIFRILFRYVNVGNEVAFFIMALAFFSLDIILIPVVDMGMRIYYFSKLTEKEQMEIVQENLKQNHKNNDSVH